MVEMLRISCYRMLTLLQQPAVFSNKIKGEMPAFPGLYINYDY